MQSSQKDSEDIVTDYNITKAILIRKTKQKLSGYKLELLTKETQNLLGDGPLIDKNKNSKNFPQLDQVKHVLFLCNLVQNDYLQNSKLLYEFVPGKRFGQLISVKPPVFNQCKASDTIFDYIEICLTDQNNKFLEIEDKVSVTLIIQNNRV